MLKTDDLALLKTQALARPLNPAERALADAMLAVFRTGTTDFAALCAELEKRGIARPSGEPGPWSEVVLEEELKRINAELDAAYQAHGIGA